MRTNTESNLEVGSPSPPPRGPTRQESMEEFNFDSSASTDDTVVVEDPSHKDVIKLSKDNCRVKLGKKTTRGDTLVCGNTKVDCRRRKHASLQGMPDRIGAPGFYTGVENSKGGLDGLELSFFDEDTWRQQRAANHAAALLLLPSAQKQQAEDRPGNKTQTVTF